MKPGQRTEKTLIFFFIEMQGQKLPAFFGGSKRDIGRIPSFTSGSNYIISLSHCCSADDFCSAMSPPKDPSLSSISSTRAREQEAKASVLNMHSYLANGHVRGFQNKGISWDLNQNPAELDSILGPTHSAWFQHVSTSWLFHRSLG